MKFQDWHTHNFMCHHAIGSLEDYIQKAIELNLDIIGFSDHFPYNYLENFENIPIEEYAMVLGELELYLSKLERLKELYNNKINVRIGFEVDYIEGATNKLNIHLSKVKSRLDYILGSIHILKSKRGFWAMDDSRFLEQYNAIGTDNVYLIYYQTQLTMLKNKKFDFDIISHFDLPKKFNKIPSSQNKFIEIIYNILDIIKRRGLVVEINTGGYRREIKEQYPSTEIIKSMYERDIPVLLGSDAHSPNELGYEFKNTIQLLKVNGYNQLASFNKRKISFIEI